MKILKDYKVVSWFVDPGSSTGGLTMEAFNAEVLSYIKDGWSLHGGVSISSLQLPVETDKYSTPFCSGKVWSHILSPFVQTMVAQALVLYEEVADKKISQHLDS